MEFLTFTSEIFKDEQFFGITVNAFNKKKKKKKKEQERKTASKKLSETSVFGNKSIWMFRIYAIIWFESSLQRTIRE